jgi:hypothetical protein
MILEDVPDSEGVKCAWQISYAAEATAAAGSTAAAGGTAAAAGAGAAAAAPPTPSSSQARSAAGSLGGETEVLQANPVAVAEALPAPLERSPSADGAEGAASAASPSASSSASSPSPSAFKPVTLYARDADEKRKWMSDLANLIEQNKQKNKTLMIK